MKSTWCCRHSVPYRPAETQTLAQRFWRYTHALGPFSERTCNSVKRQIMMLAKRLRRCTLIGPAVLFPLLCHTWTSAKASIDVSARRLCLAKIQAMVTALIVGLLSGRRPPYISWLIAPVNINAIKGMVCRRSRTDGRSKSEKIAPPRFTHRDASSAIIHIILRLLVVATIFCAYPATILWRVASTMFRKALKHQLPLQAATTSRSATAQVSASDDHGATTDTTASPKGISAWWRDLLQNTQTTKGQVFQTNLNRHYSLLLLLKVVIVLGLVILPTIAVGQGTVFVEPSVQLFDNNGDPLNGGLLYTYACGGTTNQSTYTTAALSVANANPVVLSSAGRATVFLDDLCYRFDLTTSGGTSVWSIDNVQQNFPWNGTTVTAMWQSLAPTTLTLSSNAVVPTRNVHALDTSGGAADLNTITATNVTTGFILTLTGANPGANPVTVKSGAGNISLANGSDYAMTAATSWIQLVLSGTTWYELGRSIQSTFNTTDAVTAAVTDIVSLNHASTGTPAASFGTGLLFTGESTTTDQRQMARVQARWSTATDATRTSALDFQTVSAAGALTTQMSLSGAGLMTLSGLGLHTVTTGGTGVNGWRVSNTTAGTGNYAEVSAFRDATVGVWLRAYSSTFTTSGAEVQAGAALVSEGVGGLSLAATNATGDLRFYSNGTSEVGRIDSTQFLWGDTANAWNGAGITINQGTDDNDVLTFKSSDIAHGITDLTETDTYGAILKTVGASGGMTIRGLAETGSAVAIQLTAVATDASTVRSTAATGAITLRAVLKNGTTTATFPVNSNLVTVDDGSSTRFILDSDGDSHQDVGTAWTNFDFVDDVHLLHSLAVEVSRPTDPARAAIKARFATDMKALLTRAEMTRLGLVTFNDDAHPFVNMSKLTMVHTGAIRQVGDRVGDLTVRLAAVAAAQQDLAVRLAAVEHAAGPRTVRRGR